jgi:hypothetical protein
MKLKRDLTSNAAPASNQIEVGELAINAKTGVLYSKMTDGTVIKFIGTAVCNSNNDNPSPVPVPEITFSDVTNFCCGGDSLTVYVSNLLVNHRYSCSITDLIEGSTAVATPSSSVLLPLNKSDRAVAFNININRETQPVALFKVAINELVNSNNTDVPLLRSEKIIKVCCINCSST